MKTSSQSHSVSSESAKPPLLIVPYIHMIPFRVGKKRLRPHTTVSGASRCPQQRCVWDQLELAVMGLSSSMFRGGAGVCRLLKHDLHTRLGSNNCWLGTGIF